MAFRPADTPASSVTTLENRLKLRFCAGERLGEVVELAPGMTSLGSDPSCEVRIRSGGEQVCCLMLHGAHHSLVRNLAEDAWLNGDPLTEAVLQPGDELVLGSAVLQVVETASPPPAPLVEETPETAPALASSPANPVEMLAEAALEPVTAAVEAVWKSMQQRLDAQLQEFNDRMRELLEWQRGLASVPSQVEQLREEQAEIRRRLSAEQQTELTRISASLADLDQRFGALRSEHRAITMPEVTALVEPPAMSDSHEPAAVEPAIEEPAAPGLPVPPVLPMSPVDAKSEAMDVSPVTTMPVAAVAAPPAGRSLVVQTVPIQIGKGRPGVQTIPLPLPMAAPAVEAVPGPTADVPAEKAFEPVPEVSSPPPSAPQLLTDVEPESSTVDGETREPAQPFAAPSAAPVMAAVAAVAIEPVAPPLVSASVAPPAPLTVAALLPPPQPAVVPPSPAAPQASPSSLAPRQRLPEPSSVAPESDPEKLLNDEDDEAFMLSRLSSLTFQDPSEATEEPAEETSAEESSANNAQGADENAELSLPTPQNRLARFLPSPTQGSVENDSPAPQELTTDMAATGAMGAAAQSTLEAPALMSPPPAEERLAADPPAADETSPPPAPAMPTGILLESFLRAERAAQATPAPATEEVTFEEPKRDAPVSAADLLRKMGATVGDDEDDGPEPSLPAMSPTHLTQRLQQVAVEPAPPSPQKSSSERSSSRDEEDVVDEEESIEDYMARLLNRVRSGPNSGTSPASQPVVKPSSQAAPKVEEKKEDIVKPYVRRPPAEASVDLGVMREIANESARTAIQRFSVQKRAEKKLGKLVVIFVACLVVGCSLWMVSTGMVSTYNGAIAGSLVLLVWGWQWLASGGNARAAAAPSTDDPLEEDPLEKSLQDEWPAEEPASTPS